MERKRYQVIPRTLIFVFYKDQLLLIRKQHWGGRSNALGGHVEIGEDILTSARRELAEEAGIQVPGMTLCGNIMIDEAGERPGITIFLFRGQVTDQKMEQGSEGELHWTSLDRMAQASTFADIPELAREVHAWQPGFTPIIKHYPFDLT